VAILLKKSFGKNKYQFSSLGPKSLTERLELGRAQGADNPRASFFRGLIPSPLSFPPISSHQKHLDPCSSLQPSQFPSNPRTVPAAKNFPCRQEPRRSRPEHHERKQPSKIKTGQEPRAGIQSKNCPCRQEPSRSGPEHQERQQLNNLARSRPAKNRAPVKIGDGEDAAACAPPARPLQPSSSGRGGTRRRGH
jgi:hypothetical protein